MKYTQEQIDAIHELPLSKEVFWVRVKGLFPGMIIERQKRDSGEASGRWAAIDVGSAELAEKIVSVHNEWLLRTTAGGS